MKTIIPMLVIAAGFFVFYSMKKFSHKPYVVNFAIAALVGLLVVQTALMDNLDWVGYTAITICSLAFLFQLGLGIKNVRTAKSE